MLLVAGAAAGVAAIFKAPATGAIFALEVPYQEDLARRMLLPALVASASGYLAFVAVNGITPLFEAHGAPPLSFADLAGAVGLGIAAGVCARGVRVARASRRSGCTPRFGPWTRVVGAGLTIAALFALTWLLTDEPLAIGVGYHTIDWALDPAPGVWLLLVVLVVRCLATAATVAGGGVGGLFIPLVVAGALLGRLAVGVVGGGNITLFVVIGVAAFLGAGYRVPLAAVMFVAETTGRPGFIVPGSARRGRRHAGDGPRVRHHVPARAPPRPSRPTTAGSRRSALPAARRPSTSHRARVTVASRPEPAVTVNSIRQERDHRPSEEATCSSR